MITSRKHPRETVLFAVTGMSPAVLTETVWALAHEKPAIVPDRVVVVTTSAGRERIRSELFGKPGVWAALRSAVKAGPRLRFGETAADIRVITVHDAHTGQSRELDDIRTPADNAAAADFILEQLRAFTENPDAHVIASLAGGRKTMGALVYACMSLIGRETDRLTHVLVNDPYDNSKLLPKFFFPGSAGSNTPKTWTPPPRIELANIPFVPLRNRFKDLAEMPGRFRSLVVRCSCDLKRGASRPERVRLDGARSTVTVDGLSVHLRKRAFDTLRYVVHANVSGNVPTYQPEAVDRMKAFLNEPSWLLSQDDLKRELSEIRRAFGEAGIVWRPGQRTQSLLLPPFELLD